MALGQEKGAIVLLPDVFFCLASTRSTNNQIRVKSCILTFQVDMIGQQQCHCYCWQRSKSVRHTSIYNNEAVFCLQAKKPRHSGSYEHAKGAIHNAHGTNASPDGLCTRTHTNEAFSCGFAVIRLELIEPGAATCV